MRTRKEGKVEWEGKRKKETEQERVGWKGIEDEL